MRWTALQRTSVGPALRIHWTNLQIRRPVVFPYQKWNNRGFKRRPRSRDFSIDSLSPVIVAPAVFGGLVLALWTYKCLMMIIFQNKIIYMPGVPPFSRSEKVVDYAAQCKPVAWQEIAIKAVDGTSIRLLKSSVPPCEVSSRSKKDVVVLYFQGNASSLPPRLPYLSSILKLLHLPKSDLSRPNITILALSYRGFWTSKGRPSQAGIELDAEAALEWIASTFDLSKTNIVLWGQSIGAGVATTAFANLVSTRRRPELVKAIQGLLLETPFLNLKSMLVALYPQKFLPYRYLTPFLLSSWDSQAALRSLGEAKLMVLRTLILQAGDDEIVPSDHAKSLERTCQELGMEVDMARVAGALHTEVMTKGEGKALIAAFLRGIASDF